MTEQNAASLSGLLTYLVQALVDDPDSVRVDRIDGDDATTFEIRVGPNDLGKVIGKQGRIANALRQVSKAMVGSDRSRVFVEIVA